MAAMDWLPEWLRRPSAEAGQAQPAQASPDYPGGGASLGGQAGDIRGRLNQAVNSPLFQTGMGMLAAGGEGKNIGAGFLAGNEAARNAQKGQLDISTAQRTLAAQKQRDDLQASFRGPDAPAWFKSLSPQLQGVLQSLDSDKSGQLLATVIGKQGDQAAALQQFKAQHGFSMELEKQKMQYQKDLALAERQNNLDLMDRYRQAQGGQGQPMPGQQSTMPPNQVPKDGRYKFVPGAGLQ